jgi:hemerythrin-like metal-binding protein/PAS domain S-box-containing protein
VLIGIGSLSKGVVAGTFFLLATLLLILARKAMDRTARRIMAFSGAAALALSLAHTLDLGGIQWPAFMLLARLAGFAATILGLLKVSKWRAAGPLPETRIRAGEKESAPGRQRETQTRLGDRVDEVKECAIIQLDQQGRVASWNVSAERIQGWRTEEILNRPHSVFYPEAEIRAGKPEQNLEQARAMGCVHQEAWRVRKDGSRFMASVVLAANHDGKGRVTSFTKITSDITDRREAQERLQAREQDLEAKVAIRTAELQESEARLEGFIRHVPVAIAFEGLDGRLLLVNPRAEAMMGMDKAAALGRRIEEIFPPELAAKTREQDERVMTLREEVQMEESLTLPDGSARDFLIQKFPLIDATGHGWGLGAIATDITEHNQVERAALQRQKLESLGLLASGIAHDFNNLLGAMVGNVDLLRLELAPKEHVETRLKSLDRLFDRASSLIEQILAYAGKGKFQVQPLDLNLMVEEMTRILRASLSQKASLRWEPDPNLPPMEGDLGQLQQVIMNLVLNASEAMEPKGGSITIRTGKVGLTQAMIDQEYQGQALRPGPHLTLEVADSGPGMAQRIQERIFDPFFTTKLNGRGLGLSAVQGILRSHRGGIQVQSREREGTRFRLLLPAAAASVRARPIAAPVTEREAEFRGTGTILVVDDEDALRTVAVAALVRMGFDTLEARDGLEALQVYQANRDWIRLILLDLTMPGMDGEEAYLELRRAGSMVPIILTSGFGLEDAFQRFRGKGLAGFLPKPYRFHSLKTVIRDALEGTTAKTDLPERPPRKQVAWLPEFETGDPLLDAQHQCLVNALNHLVVATEKGDRKEEAEQAFIAFIDAAIAHFGVEEGLMVETGYPNAKQHQVSHAYLTKQIQDLARQIRLGQASFTPAVFNFLEDWVHCHFQSEDKGLARHLERKGH